MTLELLPPTVEDSGRRVSYRWKGQGLVLQLGTFIRPARGRYGPGAMVRHDGREKAQFVYLSDLSWETTECRWQYAIVEATRIVKGVHDG